MKKTKVKNILIISHNAHSFLIGELKRASEQYENVIAVLPSDDDLRHASIGLSNVKLIEFERDLVKRRILLAIKYLFDPITLREVVTSFQRGYCSWGYIKELVYYLVMRGIVERCIKDTEFIDAPEEWVVLSMWYSVDAYIAACIQRKYGSGLIATLAHSYEVDTKKNKYVLGLFRNFYHDYFDKVFFISKSVKERFELEVACPLNLSLENIEVIYLGIDGPSRTEDRCRPKDRCVVLSCSHVVPIKRLDLLFYSLEKYSDVPVEWVHIGSGSELKKIENLVANNSNGLLKVSLLGALPNELIHEYYEDNNITVFVNVSKAEGIPVSIMEAISHGVPVVATDVGGNSEIVSNQYGRIIAADPKGEDIWKSIIEFDRMDEGTWKEASNQARKRFEEDFDSKKTRTSFYRYLIDLTR